MILEVAALQIKDGQEKFFETDFEIAVKYIRSAKGYIRHSLNRCQEQKNKYLLLVEWIDLAAHTIGFRESSQYIEWKKLLHHYYDPSPVVEHYDPINHCRNINNNKPVT
ncbi:MAG TPA: antibiotic biosynthesis monooxygenase [Puia sp.]